MRRPRSPRSRRASGVSRSSQLRSEPTSRCKRSRMRATASSSSSWAGSTPAPIKRSRSLAEKRRWPPGVRNVRTRRASAQRRSVELLTPRARLASPRLSHSGSSTLERVSGVGKMYPNLRKSMKAYACYPSFPGQTTGNPSQAKLATEIEIRGALRVRNLAQHARRLDGREGRLFAFVPGIPAARATASSVVGVASTSKMQATPVSRPPARSRVPPLPRPADSDRSRPGSRRPSRSPRRSGRCAQPVERRSGSRMRPAPSTRPHRPTQRRPPPACAGNRQAAAW